MTNVNEVLQDLAHTHTDVFAENVVAGRDNGIRCHEEGFPFELTGNILLGEADIIDIATRYDAKKSGKDVDFPDSDDEVVAGILAGLVGYVEVRKRLHDADLASLMDLEPGLLKNEGEATA